MKYTLEDLLFYTAEYGPKVLEELGTKITIEDAEILCDHLRFDYGMDIQPYDFPGTIDVWQSEDKTGRPYKQIAAKEFVKTVAKKEKADYTTLAGFKKLTKYFTARNFKQIKINKWGTQLNGMLQFGYDSRPSEVIFDLVNNDDDFIAIKNNLQHLDFPGSPKDFWTDEKGNPTDNARAGTKELIKSLAKEEEVDYTTVKGFKKILKSITANDFKYFRTNEHGTTLCGMLRRAYNNSSHAAVKDLVENDDDFIRIRRVGIKGSDFKKSHSI